jgi:three-Cys-motif partner protein
MKMSIHRTDHVPPVDAYTDALLRSATVETTCPACGELLDVGADTCRYCGEPLASPPVSPGEELAPKEPGRGEGIDPALLDQLGEWSLIKHEILEKYAHAYTTIVTQQPFIKKAVYADAYAGSGFAEDRDTGEQLRGSAVRLMGVTPPFDELHFIEGNPLKADVLRRATKGDARIRVHGGDAIEVLTEVVLPRCRYEDYHRALCLLDPYDLSVPWTLVHQIGQMGSVEIFYNFMIMDANRNVLWRNPERVSAARAAKMDLVWGDSSWREILYSKRADLFGDVPEKLPNEAVAEAFRKRLQDVAGFKYVPPAIPMKNTMGATVYYLFFASPNKTGAGIVEDILKKYRR